MEIKKILWPTDFSGRAEKALDQVISLTEKYQAEIHVLYVIEDLAHHPEWYGAFEEAHAKKISDFSALIIVSAIYLSRPQKGGQFVFL